MAYQMMNPILESQNAGGQDQNYVLVLVLLLLAVTAGTAVWLALRFFGLKKALREADRELKEINGAVQENRIVKMKVPCEELENFLGTVNTVLEETRRQRLIYEKRERELQKQIENISHDLRTPLTAIIGYLELIDIQVMGQEDRESLQIVKRRARTLQRLIGQFYELSRVSAGDFLMQVREVDLGRMLREMIADSYESCEMARLQLKAGVPAYPVWVRGDTDALERICQNLLQNAARYAKSRLCVSLDHVGEHTVMVFENDTQNLSQEEAERMFERFYTTDASRSQGGTGLGLTIAKYLAEAMGGSMEAGVKNKDGANWLVIRTCLQSGRGEQDSE